VSKKKKKKKKFYRLKNKPLEKVIAAAKTATESDKGSFDKKEVYLLRKTS